MQLWAREDLFDSFLLLLNNSDILKRSGSTLSGKYLLLIFPANFSGTYDGMCWEWLTELHSLVATLMRIVFVSKITEIILILVCCSLYL